MHYVRSAALSLAWIATTLSAVPPVAAVQEAAPAHPIPILGIDVYRTDAFDADWVEAEIGEDLRALFGGGLAPEQMQAAITRISEALRARGDFAYLQPSAIRYYEEDGTTMYLTLDVVDAADAAERMPFRDPPTGQVEGADELIASWKEYETKVLARMSSMGASTSADADCPAYHCLPLAFSLPELEPYAAVFDAGAREHRDVLARVLAQDADEQNRGAAAYLLAHTEDPQWIADRMVEAILDPSSLVRNNAMRVLAYMSNDGVDFDVPLDPVLRAIDFPDTTDRNKALALLTGIVEHTDAYDERIAEQSGARLIALLRLVQPNNHDFAWRVLKAISGQELGERDYASWEAWLAAVIGAGPAAAGALQVAGQQPDTARLSDPGPIELVLAVDVSYSLGAWPVHEAVTVLLDSLDPDSCVVLMPFAADGVEAIRGRPDDASLRGRLVDERFRHYSALADGLEAALTVAAMDLPAAATADGIAITGDACTVGQDDRDVTGTRRAIVLMTAGSNVPDEQSVARLTERARDVGVPIFALVTYFQASAGTLETRGRMSPFPALRALEALVAPTGGRVVRARQDPEDNYWTIWNGLQKLIGALRDFATHDVT